MYLRVCGRYNSTLGHDWNDVFFRGPMKHPLYFRRFPRELELVLFTVELRVEGIDLVQVHSRDAQLNGSEWWRGGGAEGGGGSAYRVV